MKTTRDRAVIAIVVIVLISGCCVATNVGQLATKEECPECEPVIMEKEVIVEKEVEIESKSCKVAKTNQVILYQIVELQQEKLNMGAGILENIEYYYANYWELYPLIDEMDRLNNEIEELSSQLQ